MTLPSLKWSGGKRWMAEKLLSMIFGPEGPWRIGRPQGRYVEPFLGGGAVALAMPYDVDVVASDRLVDLVETWRTVRYSPISLAHVLAEMGETHDADQYYAVRAMSPLRPLERAARFIYLNKMGFNGLYRVNRRGQCNVPIGRGRTSALPRVSELMAVAQQMRRWRVEWQDFEETIAGSRGGDVVYADPPYVGTHDYSSDFSDRDQVRLRDSLDEAWMRGASVITTNSEAAIPLYEGGHWTIARIEEPRRIAASGDRRPAECMLAWRFR